MWGFVARLANLEGESSAGSAAGNGEGGVAGQDEFFDLNHYDEYLNRN